MHTVCPANAFWFDSSPGLEGPPPDDFSETLPYVQPITWIRCVSRRGREGKGGIALLLSNHPTHNSEVNFSLSPDALQRLCSKKMTQVFLFRPKILMKRPMGRLLD